MKECEQVNTQEYPGTIGARYIQYMTTDRLTAPPNLMLEGWALQHYRCNGTWSGTAKRHYTCRGRILRTAIGTTSTSSNSQMSRQPLLTAKGAVTLEIRWFQLSFRIGCSWHLSTRYAVSRPTSRLAWQFYKIDPPVFGTWSNALRRGGAVRDGAVALWLIAYNLKGHWAVELQVTLCRQGIPAEGRVGPRNSSVQLFVFGDCQ